MQVALMLVGQPLFSADGAWRAPIAPGAILGDDPVPAGIDVGFDTWLPDDPWSIPFYTERSGLQRERLLYNPGAWLMVASGRWARFGNPPATERAILASSTDHFPTLGNVFSTIDPYAWKLPRSFNQVQNPDTGPAWFWFPKDATPSPGPDGHMAVAQPDGHVVETYATIILGDGTAVALSYSVTDPGGRGDGWQNGQTASMIPCYAGLIEDREASHDGIWHAMAITIPARLLAPRAVYPAFAFDRNALTSKPPYGGTMGMGARLALPPDLDLATLNISTVEGRHIARAAQTYGFIVVDRGGEGITLRVRRNGTATDPVLHRFNPMLRSDLGKIFAHVQQVTETDGGR